MLTIWQAALRGSRRGRIVLIHGSSSSSASWHGVGPQLANLGWEVIAVDLPGHGTQPSMGTVEPRRAAGAIQEAVGRTDVVLGHSLGAVVASHLAVSGAVDRALILEEPPGPETVDFEAVAESLEQRASEARLDPLGRMSIALEQLDWPFDDVARSIADVARCDSKSIAAAVRQGASWDIEGLVAKASLPMYLILAPDGKGRFDKDEQGSSLRGADRARLLASTRSVETAIIGQGHCPHREDPKRWMDEVHRFSSGVV